MLKYKKMEKEVIFMPQLIKDYIDRIEIGAEQSYKNLAVFPVVSDYVIPF